MKTLTRIEIQEKIVKYLKGKDIDITLTNSGGLWCYKKDYNEFRVTLDVTYNNDDKFIIRYYINYSIEGIRRRRTIASGNFCLKMFTNLMWIKKHLDIIADDNKIKIDTKNKYCTELEMYYKKMYKNVQISINKQSDSNYNISINGYDDKGGNTSYSITLSNNKYYLDNKTQSLNEILT